MAAIIDSAPNCIQHLSGYVDGDDADFILQKAYEKCGGIMTFGPGQVWGEGGHGATTMYWIVLVIGAIVTVAALVGWVLFEKQRLEHHEVRLLAHAPVGTPTPPTTF